MCRAAIASRTTSWPNTVAVPEVARVRPHTIEIQVVLPAPLGPSRAKISPSSIRKVTPFKASTLGYRLTSATVSTADTARILQYVSTMPAIDENLFDQIADHELTHLRDRLDECDPDELEVELSMGVLTITLGDGSKVVVNSHRAAGQIWMAAFKTAWHFNPKQEGGDWVWRTEKDELRSTLARVLSERVGHPIAL